MSKKVLKLAGRRPMLLALIIMATLALGIVFSGWLTPTWSKAQEGGGGGGAINENTDCVESGTTTNCTGGSVVLTNMTISPRTNSIGKSFSASVTQITNAAQVVIDTSYTNANPNATNLTCDDTYTTTNLSPRVISNWWTASVGSYSNSGAGLSASFTPTDCGSGTVTFNTTYQDVCDTNINTISLSTNFTVLSLNIAGGGGIICSANSNNVAMVGQHINLSAQTCGGTFSNFQWSVPGYAISNYTVGSGGGDNGSTTVITPESLTTYFPTTNSSVSFYWVDGGAKSVSCTAKCGAISCSTNVTISVTRPTVSMYYVKPMIWYAYSVPGDPFLGISLGDKSTHANDLNYAVLINSPTYGDAEAVQIVSLFAVNGNNQVVGQQADGCVPYVSSPNIPPGGTSDSYLPLDDSPRALVNFLWVTLAGSFDDYVMYQADISHTIYAPLGGDTIYVPLGQVKWQMNGGYDRTTISPNYISVHGPDNSTGFPIWTSIFSPSWL